jgi:poly(A)-specific ribonuclease
VQLPLLPCGSVTTSSSSKRAIAAHAASSSSSIQQQQQYAGDAVDPTSTLPPAAAAAAAPLQVTRSNFTAVLPAVRQALQDCHFFAFDCEMTGLFLQGQDDYVVDDVTDRYVKAAAAAEQFLVVQFGLSAFVWRPESNSYNVRSFNFHLFPSPQEDVDARFLCQASSLAFLASHGFDFNKVRP